MIRCLTSEGGAGATEGTRVLFVIGWPLEVGGHLNSTMSLAKEIRKRGCETFLLAGHGSLMNQFREYGTRVFALKKTSWDFWFQLKTFLKILESVGKYDIDIIQAQDYRALYPAYLASAVKGRAVVFTKAGGEAPSYIIPREIPVVVFSKELEHGMRERGYQNEILCVPERIDTEFYHDESPDSEFVDRYHLPKAGLKVIMAMRFDTQKKRWLGGVLNAVPNRCAEDIHLVLAGNGPLYNWVSAKAGEINSTGVSPTVRLIGKIANAQDMCRLYQYSDIVIGHGRGILEAMASGRPVINIGENGMGTVVDEETVGAVAYYNFSGRHLRDHPKMGKPIFHEILRLAQDKPFMERLGAFSKWYVASYYDSKRGAERILKLYCTAQERKRMTSLRGVPRFLFERYRHAMRNRMAFHING